MNRWLHQRVDAVYERLLSREIDGAPTHVAVIQDGNRRYARRQGGDASEGHRAGAETTERVLEWCQDIGVEELTLYAFSTENFERPDEENEALFDLLCEKLREFADADRVHDNEVCIRAIGETELLPERVQEVVDYAERRTRDYDRFVLNIALAYGGRSRLLEATRAVASEVEAGELEPDEIDVETIERQLYDRPVRDVDLIIRTGGDERTSNFLPWHANGNEAAVFFCTPYWPEFSKTDFLRGIRTYEHRAESWRRTRARRALALLGALGETELPEARSVVDRFRDSLPTSERPVEGELSMAEDVDGEPVAD
ncbi:polyprenyl diphosphate synthase [Natronobacterium gregoryi]|uniref:Tritrans,polycis-undecaprenyl-diphosphate synthase (geranylgeranyl-diphosphate specific) n=2 Tax=Natronobacterium gregoryi TaxID=44930 RepID=L0AMA7_NATGS|nr:polyprenyl diphosphate synthase [Natronobacterium gregoryi]AFZ74322.1 undecaprenyl diphosphate synthase [Natronobacterium gregoryi SP2]ELY63554.1 UDP diphosphate synthase [Natronobacterium gregoryi SP2]PLK22169.1 di-trans,poly-cis-decaprenylcistransferase [Natronobacterium gregoryi SP2]SFI53703.1 tritrans,polycis-undecaprenyl-diphosphate synthase [geranylgeranyl-diphosphate specific] [Natronobacterium gregoryi]